MTLEVSATLRRGSLWLDARLEPVGAGETLAVVGPNGAGKSTLLELLAGLERCDSGTVRLDGQVLDGGSAGPFVLPEERRVGLVFQDHLLFPHLSVLENVAFGPRCRGLGSSTAAAKGLEWLERLGLEELAAARPGELSGGQSQRVALARALAIEPRMLLLDEPLAAVDASSRISLLRVLREQLEGFEGVRVVVTHTIADALALADRLAVLEAGAVVQCGTVEELVQRPGSRYVADLVGLNCFRGVAEGSRVEVEGGQLVVAEEAAGPVLLTIHPRAVSLFRSRPEGSPRNSWSGPVVGVEPSLERVRVRIDGPLPMVAEVTPGAARELALVEGVEVWLTVKATEISVAPS